MNKRTLLTALCLVPMLLLAQPSLLIRKKNNPGNLRFFGGEQIRIKLKMEEVYIRGTITGFHGDTAISINMVPISLYNIEKIDVRNKSRSFGPKLMLAGPLYMGIGLLNQGQRKNAGILLLPTVSLLASGGILWLLKKREITLGRKYHLYIS